MLLLAMLVNLVATFRRGLTSSCTVTTDLATELAKELAEELAGCVSCKHYSMASPAKEIVLIAFFWKTFSIECVILEPCGLGVNVFQSLCVWLSQLAPRRIYTLREEVVVFAMTRFRISLCKKDCGNEIPGNLSFRSQLDHKERLSKHNLS